MTLFRLKGASFTLSRFPMRMRPLAHVHSKSLIKNIMTMISPIPLIHAYKVAGLASYNIHYSGKTVTEVFYCRGRGIRMNYWSDEWICNGRKTHLMHIIWSQISIHVPVETHLPSIHSYITVAAVCPETSRHKTDLEPELNYFCSHYRFCQKIVST